jgi:hypothetical protein
MRITFHSGFFDRTDIAGYWQVLDLGYIRYNSGTDRGYQDTQGKVQGCAKKSGVEFRLFR